MISETDRNSLVHMKNYLIRRRIYTASEFDALWKASIIKYGLRNLLNHLNTKVL